MDFTQFKNKWLGHVVDYDRVYKFQCVDLILQYIYECYGINRDVSGNAIDYWTKTGVNGFNQALLNKFNKIPNTEVQQGDIVVLNGLPGNPYGHIGIATGNINATEVEILEQNGQDGSGNGLGGNVIRTRYIARNRVAGLLRPQVLASVPAPASAPATGLTSNDNVFLPATVASWAVYKTDSQLRKGTADQIGNLAPAKFGGLLYKIVSWIGDHAVVINTESFGQVAIWVKGTSAAFSRSTPPPPVAPPAAPLNAPSSETYDLIKDLDGYVTSNMAINRDSPRVKIPKGTYYVFNKRFDEAEPSRLLAVNLTKTSGNAGAWVNIADNTNATLPSPPEPVVPEPIVEPVQLPEEENIASSEEILSALYQTLKPQVYVAMRDLPVVDLAGKRKTVTMPKYSVTYISGTLPYKGKVYAIPKSAYDKGLYYGVEWTDPETNLVNLELESDVFNSKTTLTDRQVTKTTKLIDHLALAAARFRKLYLGFTVLLGKMRLAKKTKN